MLSLLAGVYNMGEKGMVQGPRVGPWNVQVPIVGVVVWLITWVAVLSVLFSLARLLWKKGNKVK